MRSPAEDARPDAPGEDHWAYRPVAVVAPPAVANSNWPSNAIDHFILARIEAAGLTPSTDAPPENLVRRLSFDLLGLPPEPETIERFAADASAEAWQKLVDRLLASPHFGERWGRHWLDVARYAESLSLRGFVLPEAWRYRDYVVAAFNEDMPFDRFIQEQIAGDLLPAGSLEERQRQLVAATALLLGNTNLEEQDKRQLEMDLIDEQLEFIGRAFLGQSLGCARCHDHKFDPITARDYYALAGILHNSRALEHANVSKWIEVPLPQEPARERFFARQEEELAAARTRLEAARKRLETANNAAQRGDQPAGKRGEGGPGANQDLAALRGEVARSEEELKRLRAAIVRRPMVMSLIEHPAPGNLGVMVRGNVHAQGEPVPRGFLTAFEFPGAPAVPPGEGGRKQLALWVSERANPLTARVYVNRVWHWLLGAGLSRTTDNFGATGERPLHPELLDELAATFMAEGWSTKRLIRRIVTSRVYRLAVEYQRATTSIDPENRLWARGSRRRLDAEALHDSLLVLGGQWIREAGGPSFPHDLETDFGFARHAPRRAIYLPMFRNALPEMLALFDVADPSLVTGSRATSNVAPQALFLLNNPWVRGQSGLIARRVLAEAPASTASRVKHAFRLVLGRAATSQEISLALIFLEGAPAGDAGQDEAEAFADFVQALIASLDFRYLN